MTDHSVQNAFRINLEQQKKRAKELLERATAGELASLQRIAAHRAVPKPSDIKLADAQFTIARELGLPSWSKLKEHVLSMERERTRMEAKQRALDADIRTLHIRCGSDIRLTLVHAGFIGDFLEHSYPYCRGPVTEGPDALERRARFVADAYGDKMNFSFLDALERLRNGEELLNASSDYDRVVLWMEHDSYDQLVLVRCLAHYAATRAPRILELVSANHFAGSARYIGLGQLPAEALRLLWARRGVIGPAQLDLASQVWAALTADDPSKLAAIARGETAALPDLARALQRHLRELPSVENGLSLTEQLTLEVLAEESCAMGDIFVLNHRGREPLPWLGDIMFWHILEQMEQASDKVFVRAEDTAEEMWARQRLIITETGRAVLRGEIDWISLNPPERWVGGVRVHGKSPVWRWSETHRGAIRL